MHPSLYEPKALWPSSLYPEVGEFIVRRKAEIAFEIARMAAEGLIRHEYPPIVEKWSDFQWSQSSSDKVTQWALDRYLRKLWCRHRPVPDWAQDRLSRECAPSFSVEPDPLEKLTDIELQYVLEEMVNKCMLDAMVVVRFDAGGGLEESVKGRVRDYIKNQKEQRQEMATEFTINEARSHAGLPPIMSPPKFYDLDPLMKDMIDREFMYTSTAGTGDVPLINIPSDSLDKEKLEEVREAFRESVDADIAKPIILPVDNVSIVDLNKTDPLPTYVVEADLGAESLSGEENERLSLALQEIASGRGSLHSLILPPGYTIRALAQVEHDGQKVDIAIQGEPEQPIEVAVRVESEPWTNRIAGWCATLVIYILTSLFT